MKSKRLVVIFLIFRILISVFLIILVSVYPLCVSSTHAKVPHGIILISLDTLRADHLGIYGYSYNTSPFIDVLAKESIVFENAVVQSPWTLPSHMSIMTSLYPLFHGVVRKSSRLADRHVTLAELLQGGGYKTVAFTDGGWMSAKFGFDQGFDIYDGELKVGIAHLLPKVKKWIDKNKSSPFFLFLHCYDIHSPYNPPPSYNKIFHDFTYKRRLVTRGGSLGTPLRNKSKLKDEDLRYLMALYDGGIRYTDEKIGEFLSYLRDSGLENQSLIIITSDHGEEFMEHGNLSHRQLYYRPNLHVPLIMRIPNYPKREIRINELVQSVDLLPTILDVAGLPAHPKAQGQSLLPLIKRHRNFLNYFLWKGFHLFTKDTSLSFAEYGRRNKYRLSVITDRYQMIRDIKSHVQLFNLKADPLAQDNIAMDHEDITERLFFQWKELYSTKRKYTPSKIYINKQTREQLKALGYIDGPEHGTDSPDDIPDGDD